MVIEKLRPSFTYTDDRLAELRAVVPEAFADGTINWDTLREALGVYTEDEGRDAEHFGLTWPGKHQARRLAAQPSKGALVPAAGEGINEATTRNLFIEGDNLEVLKLLQKSYAGRVKMIYIDPPYNTGNDFIYRDDYSEPLEEYLRKTGQISDEGEMLVTNSAASGRFHSNWLNMIYPRLRLARSLLREDGVIFVSINDTEMHHLKSVMDEVFGEESFVGNFVWQSKKGGGSDKDGVVNDQEYVLCYRKLSIGQSLSKVAIESEPLDKMDEKGAYRRGRELNKWGSGSRREDRPKLFFPIPGPKGEDVYPIRNDGSEGRWRMGKEKVFKILNRGDAEFVRRSDGTYIVYEKIRSTDPRAKPYRTWLSDVGTTADGSKAVKELFNGRKVYDFPKPVDLLKLLLEIGTSGNGDIVLDFFAGSCTTAQAILEVNREKDGDRQFICVQLPEPTPEISEARKAGYRTITELGKERIRRVITHMRQESDSQLDLEDREEPEDLGFRVYKLGRSNYKAWQAYQGESILEIETLFDRIETPLVDGWKFENVLTEVLLLQGFPLDSKITTESGFKQNHVQRVESDAVGHRLFICLDTQLADATIEQIRLAAEDVFVCLDSALSDEAKLRLADRCTLRVI